MLRRRGRLRVQVPLAWHRSCSGLGKATSSTQWGRMARQSEDREESRLRRKNQIPEKTVHASTSLNSCKEKSLPQRKSGGGAVDTSSMPFSARRLSLSRGHVPPPPLPACPCAHLNGLCSAVHPPLSTVLHAATWRGHLARWLHTLFVGNDRSLRLITRACDPSTWENGVFQELCSFHLQSKKLFPQKTARYTLSSEAREELRVYHSRPHRSSRASRS